MNIYSDNKLFRTIFINYVSKYLKRKKENLKEKINISKKIRCNSLSSIMNQWNI